MTDQNHNDLHDSMSDGESRFIDALLHRTFASDEKVDQARVERLISTISGGSGPGESEETPETVANIVGEANRSRTARKWQWWAFPAIAVTLLLGLFIVLPNGMVGNEALAALDVSLLADARAESRQYLVTMKPRVKNGAEATPRQTNLYLKGDDFVIQVRPPLGRADRWMGSYQGEQWAIPRVGPVIVGRDSLAKMRMLQNAVAETPILSITAVLERTKRFYDLKYEKSVDVVLRQGEEQCSLVTGVRRTDARSSVPQSVKVWADQETGFVKKIELGWLPTDRSTWASATAEWIDSPDLDDDFFQHQAHHHPERRVIDQETETTRNPKG